MSECRWMEVMSDPCPRMLRLKQPSRSHPRESAPHCGKKNTPDMSGPAAIHPSIPRGTLRLHWPAGRCMWAGRNPPPVWSLAGRAGGNLNTTALFPLTFPWLAAWGSCGDDIIVCVCVWRETHSGHRCHLSEEHSDSNTCRSLLRLHTCHLNTTHTYWSTAWIHSCILTVGVGFSKRSLCSVGVGSNVNSTFILKKVPLRENFHLGKISRYCASTCGAYS